MNDAEGVEEGQLVLKGLRQCGSEEGETLETQGGVDGFPEVLDVLFVNDFGQDEGGYAASKCERIDGDPDLHGEMCVNESAYVVCELCPTLYLPQLQSHQGSVQ